MLIVYHLPSHPVHHGAPEEVCLCLVWIRGEGEIVIEFSLLEINLHMGRREEYDFYQKVY